MPDVLTEIKTPEQAIAMITKQQQEIIDLKAQIATCIEDGKRIAALEGKATGYETTINDLKAVVKEQQLTIINKGAWRETDQKAVFHENFGRFCWALREACLNRSKVATGKLEKMGAKAIKDKVGPRNSPDWEVDEVFLKSYPGAEKVATSTPLTGDNSEGGSFYGGYTVPVKYMTELLRIAGDASIMMNQVTTFPVTGITAYFPYTDTEITFTEQTNQNTAYTEKSMTFGQRTETTRCFAGWVGIVDAFLEDTVIDTGALLATMFMEAWGMRFDYECLVNATYGALYTGTLVYTMDSGAFSAIDPEDLLGMLDLFTGDKQKSRKENGKFIMESGNWSYLIKDKTADGAYKVPGVWQNPPANIAWGKPVLFSSKMPDTGDSAVNTKFIIFMNPKFIYNGMRKDLEFRVFDRTVDNMTNGIVYFRMRTRQAFLNTQPGSTAVCATKA